MVEFQCGWLRWEVGYLIILLPTTFDNVQPIGSIALLYTTADIFTTDVLHTGGSQPLAPIKNFLKSLLIFIFLGSNFTDADSVVMNQ